MVQTMFILENNQLNAAFTKYATVFFL